MGQSQNPSTKPKPAERSPADLVEVLLEATEHSVGHTHLFSPPPDKRPDPSLPPDQRLAPDHLLPPDEPPIPEQRISPTEGADAKRIALTWASVSVVLMALTWLAATLSE